jgi:hypothetical protein
MADTSSDVFIIGFGVQYVRFAGSGRGRWLCCTGHRATRACRMFEFGLEIVTRDASPSFQ